MSEMIRPYLYDSPIWRDIQ